MPGPLVDEETGVKSSQNAPGSMEGKRNKDVLVAGQVEEVAAENRLSIGVPRYEQVTLRNLTRVRSADEHLWHQFTEAAELPDRVEWKRGDRNSPYQAEIVGRGKRSLSIFKLPMLRPDGIVARIWVLLISICDITYTAFLVPLSWAFFHDVRVFNWMSVLDIFGSSMYVLDVIFSFHIGVVFTKSMHARAVMEGKLVAAYYIRHSTFVLDCLAAMPLVPEVVLLCLSRSASGSSIISQIVSWLRLIRLLRLLPLVRSLIALSLTGHFNRRMLQYIPSSILLGIHCIYLFLGIGNFLGCIWYYTAVAEGLEKSWLRSVGSISEDLSGASGVSQYIASFYFAVTTLSTVGYGDITATTTAERVVATVMMFIGIAFFGFVLGVLQSVIQRGGSEARRAEMFRGRIPHVETWMKNSELPRDLRDKIRAYYACVWVRHEEVDERLMFDQLPIYLRGQVASYLTDGLLYKSRAFKSLDDTHRKLLASICRPVPVAPGHDIFSQNAEADRLYILQDGEVELIRDIHQIEQILAPYLLGEVSILNIHGRGSYKQPYSARARSLCMLWEIRLSDLLPLMNSRPALETDVLADLRTVMQRLHDQQPDNPCWKETMQAVEERLANLKSS